MFVFGGTNSLTDDEKIKQKILTFLLEQKGYLKDDIIVDKEFEILLDGKSHKSSVDLLIKLQEKLFMIIRCARGSIVSREREVLSAARIVTSYQIPFSVVTNGLDTEIIDSATGEVISYDLNSIPSKSAALESLQKIKFRRLSEDRIEKEKRIFLVFDAIKCPSECH